MLDRILTAPLPRCSDDVTVRPRTAIGCKECGLIGCDCPREICTGCRRALDKCMCKSRAPVPTARDVEIAEDETPIAGFDKRGIDRAVTQALVLWGYRDWESFERWLRRLLAQT